MFATFTITYFLSDVFFISFYLILFIIILLILTLYFTTFTPEGNVDKKEAVNTDKITEVEKSKPNYTKYNKIDLNYIEDSYINPIIQSGSDKNEVIDNVQKYI